MLVLLVVPALILAWIVRFGLAAAARKRYCPGCVTLAIRVPGPSRNDKRWRHGYARMTDDAIEWRREYRLTDGFDYTIRRVNLVVRDHHPVRPGEAALSELCEYVDARYMDEDVQLGVLRADLDRFLAWAGGA